jgi:hypothetical protein
LIAAFLDEQFSMPAQRNSATGLLPPVATRPT